MGKSLIRKEVAIIGEYIALGQFLKFVDAISQGGEAKAYLATCEVKVNGELENRRGRKLRPGDTVDIKEGSYLITG